MDSFIGEIRLFAGTFAPVGWLMCQGQVLSIQQYTTLFTLIGTTYGGDGITTFALPDLRGRVPIHRGDIYQLGQAAGVEQVTLTPNELPAHTHQMPVSTNLASSRSAAGGTPAALSSEAAWTSDPADESRGTTTVSGGSQPHPNIQPSLGIVHIICVDDGQFPPRP